MAGDAAACVDPITGEGLYYAIRSGDLAAQVVLAEAHSSAGKAEVYRDLLWREFAADLEFGSSLAQRVFLGRFLLDTIPGRMVSFVRRSARFRAVVEDLMAGTQPYLSLKQRLLQNLNGTLGEVAMNFFLQELIHGKT
jgi:flavin-dependent dehydrogenase